MGILVGLGKLAGCVCSAPKDSDKSSKICNCSESEMKD